MSRAVHYAPQAPVGPVPMAGGPQGVPDPFWDRFVKYVPAEGITFCLAVGAIGKEGGTAAPPGGLQTGIAVGLGIVIAAIFAGISLRTVPKPQRRPVRFLSFALVAYLFWCVGMTDVLVRVAPGTPDWLPRILLLFAVFAIPGADQLTEG